MLNIYVQQIFNLFRRVHCGKIQEISSTEKILFLSFFQISIWFLEEIFRWYVTWQAWYPTLILVCTMYIPSILANILWEKIVNNNSRVRGHVTSLRICLRVANAIFYERTIPELRNLCCHFVKLRFWTILILCTLW